MSLKELSDDEYLFYLNEKVREGKNYFWHKDKNIIILGKFDKVNGRLFYFKDNKYSGKSGVYTAGQICNLKAEMISEEEFIRVCKNHLNLNKKVLENIIDLKIKSLSELEGMIPEAILNSFALEGGCPEDYTRDLLN